MCSLLPKDRMPETYGFRSFSIIIAILLVCLLLGGGAWYGSRLVLAIIPDGGQTPVYYPINTGDTWHYSFTHSVQKTPVEEYFVVEGADELNMQYTRYRSLGVGLPFAPSEGAFKQMPDGYFILEMNRHFTQVAFRIHPLADPYITIKGQRHRLCSMYEQGSLVQVVVKRRFKFWLQ